MAVAANIYGNFAEKYQFLRQVVSPEGHYLDQTQITEKLYGLQPQQIHALALFVIRECAGSVDHEEDFKHFTHAFFALEHDDAGIEDADISGLDEGEISEIDLTFLRRCGIESEILRDHYAKMSEEVKQPFVDRIDQFMTDPAEIDAIDSVARAKDVAARWFGGSRYVNYHMSLHLQRLLLVISDADADFNEEIALVKSVMSLLGLSQGKEFLKHGFLQREIGYPEPDDLSSAGETVEVTVPCGRRAWAAFKAGEIDGSFINGTTESGLQVNLDNSAEVARRIAAKHFDDPIIVTLRVPQGTIQDGRIYSRYSLSFGEDHITPVAYDSYEKPPIVDLQIDYHTLDEEQRLRLERLLYDDRSPPPIPRPPTPEPGQRPTPPSQDNPQPSAIPVKKIVWVAAGVLLGYLIITRVGAKVGEWMQEKPIRAQV